MGWFEKYGRMTRPGEPATRDFMGEAGRWSAANDQLNATTAAGRLYPMSRTAPAAYAEPPTNDQLRAYLLVHGGGPDAGDSAGTAPTAGERFNASRIRNPAVLGNAIMNFWGRPGGYMARPAGAFGTNAFGWNPQAGGGVQSDVDAFNAQEQARLNQIMMMLSGMGTSERNRISSEGASQIAGMRQGMINRGLGSSSVLGSVERRGQESTSYRMSQLADMLTGRRVGVLERVQVVPPPVSQFLASAEELAYNRGMANRPREAPYRGPAPYNRATGPQPGMPDRPYGREPSREPTPAEPEEYLRSFPPGS
jgi:hypothetical protein